VPWPINPGNKGKKIKIVIYFKNSSQSWKRIVFSLLISEAG
jgi:hypothetical protein